MWVCTTVPMSPAFRLFSGRSSNSTMQSCSLIIACLQRIRGDQPRRNLSLVQLPHGPHPRSSPVRSDQLAVDFVARAKPGLCGFGNCVVLTVFPKSLSECSPLLGPKAERCKEPRFARPIAMRGIEQIGGDLLLLNNERVQTWKLHRFALSSTSVISSGVRS